jgi:hypothetical protein
VIPGGKDPEDIDMTNKNGVLPNPFPGHVQVTTTTTVASTPKYKFKKAGTNGNLIAVVLDESGSMNVCRDTTIAGFNEFVQGQRDAANAGAGYLTLNKFEGGNIRTVFTDRPLSEVPKLDHAGFTPAGGTNLLDAIGHTIEQVNASLDKLKKKDRPGVIVLIMTDGEENCSRKYNNDMVKAMVAAAEKADWSFVFLGANIDAFSVGATFGMNALNSVNYSTANMTATMAATSTMTTNMRSAKLAGLDTHAVYASTSMSKEDRERIK